VWRLFGVEARKAVAGRGTKARAGTGRVDADAASEVSRDPRCGGFIEREGLCLGLDACSSLELEYAEALRAGGTEGFFVPGANGSESECADGLSREARCAGGLGG
jgi:hypothetical protein